MMNIKFHFFLINIASPKLKKRILFFIAKLYNSNTLFLPAKAETNISKLDLGK